MLITSYKNIAQNIEITPNTFEVIKKILIFDSLIISKAFENY
jgi:hypothetical protein